MTAKHLLAICLLSVVATLSTYSQSHEGSWTVFPTSGYNFESVEDTGSKVYMLTGGNLFSRDEDDQEFYAYTYGNKLSGTDIDKIFYNPEGEYLLVCYPDGNLDLVYDDGRSFAMPEIRDAVLSTGHRINDAAFDNGRIYLATEFGIVVYNDELHEVIESGIYNVSIDNIEVSGDRLLITTGNKVYCSPKTDRHVRLDSFDIIHPNMWGLNFRNLGDNLFVYTHKTRKDLWLLTFDFDAGTYKGSNPGIIIDGLLYRNRDGGVWGQSGNKLVFIDSEGNITTAELPEAFAGRNAFTSGNLSSVWIDTGAGLGHYDLSGNTVTVLSEPFSPEAVTMPEVAYMGWNTSGDGLYIGNLHPTHNLYGGRGDDFDNPQLLNEVDPRTGAIRDVSVVNYETTNPLIVRQQNRTGWKGLPGGPTRFIADPDEEGLYYQGTNNFGFFAIKDGEVVKEINDTNAPIAAISRGYDVNIDRHGNLWIGVGYKKAPEASYYVLPAEKRRSKLANIERSDWIPVVAPSTYTGNRDMFSHFCRKSNYAVFSQGNDGGLLVLDTKGTSDTGDDTFVHHTQLTDNDGNTMSGSRLINVAEDNRGQLWFASPYGVLVLQDLSTGMSSTMRLRRPIVARNDGTAYGDYLLDGEIVYDIAVDHSNRKWIATETSGVYLVNEDGTAILRHFDSENSPMTSNVVYSVACDPASNKVFFGTPEGLIVYDGDSSPAAEDYSEVYAYPNPVRPEYTGWITIAGLMEDSLVKIADIAGNVVFQGRSEGGMVTWDGCSRDGQRVRTGVYLVFASSNGDSGSKGAVTKIMIVN